MWDPPPHVTEQLPVLHEPTQSTGQPCVLQAADSCFPLGNGQLPPSEAGLETRNVRRLEPPPQLAEQALHSLHAATQSTAQFCELQAWISSAPLLELHASPPLAAAVEMV